MADINCKFPMMHDAIAHIDLATGKRDVRMLDSGDVASEPVFVPRSASALEGEGYIIALVYRAANGTSELLILDAQDIAGEPAAVLKLPRRVCRAVRTATLSPDSSSSRLPFASLTKR
ncbi:MAG TPA: carotenoid oxygenase family protein [Pirellulales bacterium]|nr:carotenoid oxygenase family protein [Pirellulales bacterium]